MLSPSDTAIVFLLALLLFGPEQLPKLARQLGEAMRHIQTTTHSFMQEMERADVPEMQPIPADPISVGTISTEPVTAEPISTEPDTAEPVMPEPIVPHEELPAEKTAEPRSLQLEDNP